VYIYIYMHVGSTYKLGSQYMCGMMAAEDLDATGGDHAEDHDQAGSCSRRRISAPDDDWLVCLPLPSSGQLRL